PKVFPIVHLPGDELWNDQLPEEFARGLIENHQDAAIPLMLWIARVVVVCSHIDFSSCDSAVAVALRTELRHPLHVFGGGHVNLFGARFWFAWVEAIGQAFLIRVHIAFRTPSPLRPIFGQEIWNKSETGTEKASGQYFFFLHFLPWQNSTDSSSTQYCL